MIVSSDGTEHFSGVTTSASPPDPKYTVAKMELYHLSDGDSEINHLGDWNPIRHHFLGTYPVIKYRPNTSSKVGLFEGDGRVNLQDW